MKGGCPEGQAPVFQRSPDVELLGSDGFVETGLSIDDCLQACETNTAPDGSAYDCLSFDFQEEDGVCVLTSEAAAPRRSGLLTAASGSAYFEKTCLTSSVARLCEGRELERYSQFVMVGFGETVESVGSFWPCDLASR